MSRSRRTQHHQVCLQKIIFPEVFKGAVEYFIGSLCRTESRYLRKGLFQQWEIVDKGAVFAHEIDGFSLQRLHEVVPAFKFLVFFL